MQTKLITSAVLLAMWTATATAGGSDVKQGLERLKGTWKLVYEENAGVKIPVKPNEVFIFDRDMVVNKVGDKITDELFVRIAPGKTPIEKALEASTTLGCMGSPGAQGLFLVASALLAERRPALDLWGVDICFGYKMPYRAIYKLQGNKLTLCVNFTSNGIRPTDFSTNATNTRIYLLIMEKIESQGK
jgi:hypothetical protein